MTIERARELLKVQVGMVGGYNRNAARLIRELDLETVFGIAPGAVIKP